MNTYGQQNQKDFMEWKDIFGFESKPKVQQKELKAKIVKFEEQRKRIKKLSLQKQKEVSMNTLKLLAFLSLSPISLVASSLTNFSFSFDLFLISLVF